MYIKEKNLLFVHIPKNGGTSISKFFGNFIQGGFGYAPPTNSNFQKLSVGEKAHLTIEQYVTLGIVSKEDIFTTNSFAVIRDPIDRAASLFFYLKRKGSVSPEMTAKIFFSEWLPNQLFKEGKLRYFVLPQYDFITFQDRIIVKTLLNFNNLNSEFKKFSKSLGIDQNKVLGMHNVGGSLDPVFLEEARNYKGIVETIYNKDYEIIHSLQMTGKAADDYKTS